MYNRNQGKTTNPKYGGRRMRLSENLKKNEVYKETGYKSWRCIIILLEKELEAAPK
jgi:hypothetical protein